MFALFHRPVNTDKWIEGRSLLGFDLVKDFKAIQQLALNDMLIKVESDMKETLIFDNRITNLGEDHLRMTGEMFAITVKFDMGISFVWVFRIDYATSENVFPDKPKYHLLDVQQLSQTIMNRLHVLTEWNEPSDVSYFLPIEMFGTDVQRPQVINMLVNTPYGKDLRLKVTGISPATHNLWGVSVHISS